MTGIGEFPFHHHDFRCVGYDSAFKRFFSIPELLGAGEQFTEQRDHILVLFCAAVLVGTFRHWSPGPHGGNHPSVDIYKPAHTGQTGTQSTVEQKDSNPRFCFLFGLFLCLQVLNRLHGAHSIIFSPLPIMGIRTAVASSRWNIIIL